MKVKTLLIVTAILFQIIAVASIAISKETLLQTGKPLTLQTAPVDPRDIFKGDYVRLDYSFSSIPYHQLGQELKQQGLKKGQRVYLSITTDDYGLGQAQKLLIKPPDITFYLSGYATSHWPYKNYHKSPAAKKAQHDNNHPVNVKFGIEQYFVEQGQGKVLEEIRGSRDSFQQPMLVRIAVAENGTSIIHSFKWANIAMKTKVIREAERDAPDNQSNATIRFTLENLSKQAISLPLKDKNCSFILVPASRNPQHQQIEKFVFNRERCDKAVSQEKILKPNETYSIDFDLNQPQWLVNYNNKLTVPARLPWDYRYRIIYDGEKINGIDANIISSAFHGNGRID